jgi:hypothetical protein
MGSIKVFRSGKETFCEWRFENSQSIGRILNQGAGIFLEKAFSSLEEAKALCERELEKDASLIFYVVQGDDIIDIIQNDAYHIAKEKKASRGFAAVSTVIVMLFATAVSFMFMPFQAMIYDALFIGGMGAFYLLVYSNGGSCNLDGIILMIILLALLSVIVPLLSR